MRNESLFKWSRSHDKDDRHAHICPYMVKAIKDNFLWNRKADDLETWYTALSTQVLPSLFKCCPWVDLSLFYSKVKFGPLCYCMGKS